MQQVVEIVRFKVAPENSGAFVEQRGRADEALALFRGFLGSELLEGEPGTWTLLVRWATRDDVSAAQAVTLTAPGLPALSAWIALASENVSFETVDVRHSAPVADVATNAAQANLAVALRFANEGLGQADMAAFDSLVDAHVVVTTGLSPSAPISGLAAYKDVFAGFSKAWPVRQFVVEDSFATGDKVVVRFVATTVFREAYYGVPATGVVAPLHEMHLYTLRGGRIVEVVVGAVNLPFEFIMYPALKDAVLGGLAHAAD